MFSTVESFQKISLLLSNFIVWPERSYSSLPDYLELLEDPQMASNWPIYSNWNYFLQSAGTAWIYTIYRFEVKRRACQQWFTAMKEAYWVPGAPGTHHLIPSTSGHSHPLSLPQHGHHWPLRNLRSLWNSSMRPFLTPPVGESKCRVLQPSIPSASPTVQHSDLLIYYVCSLSHEDRDFFSLVSALSPASRTHSEMEVLRNYTLSDEETDACPPWGTVRSILHEGRKTTQP